MSQRKLTGPVQPNWLNSHCAYSVICDNLGCVETAEVLTDELSDAEAARAAKELSKDGWIIEHEQSILLCPGCAEQHSLFLKEN